MAQRVLTLPGNDKLVLSQKYAVAAHVDGTGEPAPAVGPPQHDAMTCDEKYGVTNNIRYIRYRVGGKTGTIVGTKELYYAGNGAADDDVLTGFAWV